MSDTIKGRLKNQFLKVAGIGLMAVASVLPAATQEQKPLISSQSNCIEILPAATPLKLQPGVDGLASFLHDDDWRYGDNSAHIDFYRGGYFAEIAPRLSLGKITGRKLAWGPVKDLLLAADVEFTQGQPPVPQVGAGMDLAVPGLSSLQVNAYLRDDPLLRGRTGQLSVAWGANLSIASKNKLLAEGLINFTGREGTSAANVEAQPQVWLDLGNYAGHSGKVYAGGEVHIWHNKFGQPGVNEVVPQIGMKLVF